MANLAHKIVQHLRTVVLRPEGVGLTDGQLLECYVRQREETSFAALVRRHGPMVWGVCRRLLPNFHDAEDAFQATFLVLVRKAESVRPREMVANWLHGVAFHTAQKARALSAKRAVRERQVVTMPELHTVEQHLEQDLQPMLDRELLRLPDKYRVPIVLCDLEGKSYKDAARQLGCPEGTLAARLARARAMLAQRLSRQGLVVSGGALAAVLAVSRAEACVPTALLSSTIQAGSLFAAGPAAVGTIVSAKVAALTEGVMHTMLLSKLKIATAFVCAIGILGTGTGLVPSSKAGAAPLAAHAASPQEQDKKEKDDLERKIPKEKFLKEKILEEAWRQGQGQNDDKKKLEYFKALELIEAARQKDPKNDDPKKIDEMIKKKVLEEARRKVQIQNIILDLDTTIRKQEHPRRIEMKIQELRLELKQLEQLAEKQPLERLIKELSDAVDKQKKETARMEKLVKELKDAVDKQRAKP